MIWTCTWQLTINSVDLRDMSLGSQPGWCVGECKGAVRRHGCGVGLHPQSILALQPTPAITQQMLGQCKRAVLNPGGVFKSKVLRIRGIPILLLTSYLKGQKPSEHSKHIFWFNSTQLWRPTGVNNQLKVLVYDNDIESSLRYRKLVQYAEDSTLLFSGKSKSFQEPKSAEDLNNQPTQL